MRKEELFNLFSIMLEKGHLNNDPNPIFLESIMNEDWKQIVEILKDSKNSAKLFELYTNGIIDEGLKFTIQCDKDFYIIKQEGFWYSYFKALDNFNIWNCFYSVPAFAFTQVYIEDEVELPSGIGEIGYKAFYMSGVTKVILPQTLQHISYLAFDPLINNLQYKGTMEEFDKLAQNKREWAYIGTNIVHCSDGDYIL